MTRPIQSATLLALLVLAFAAPGARAAETDC